MLLAPRSVAFIGASPEAGERRRHHGQPARGRLCGPAVVRQSAAREIEGEPCYASPADLPGVPDLGVIATPPATIPALIAELGAKGTRAAVVITAGIGGELRRDMLKAAQPYCLRIQGAQLPRAAGAAASGSTPASATACRSRATSRSCRNRARWSRRSSIGRGTRGIGFSHVVSMGDMADVDFGDLLDYLAGDAESRAILLYMEQLTQAPKFLSAARRAARAKPVIVLQGGPRCDGARAATVAYGRARGLGRRLQRHLPPRRPVARQGAGRAVRGRRGPVLAHRRSSASGLPFSPTAAAPACSRPTASPTRAASCRAVAGDQGGARSRAAADVVARQSRRHHRRRGARALRAARSRRSSTTRRATPSWS